MFAIVDIAGTQELVRQGQKLQVPLHADAEQGKTVTFEKILLIADGDKISVGAPTIAGATVVAKILGHGKSDKVRVGKFHRRKRYRRIKGHRQNYTEIEISKISL